MVFSFGLLLQAFEDDRVLESIRSADNLFRDPVGALPDRSVQRRSNRARCAATATPERGVTDFLTVLDTERTLLQAEQQYATSTTNVALDLVQLFKALGGGWELTFPDPPFRAGLVSAQR